MSDTNLTELAERIMRDAAVPLHDEQEALCRRVIELEADLARRQRTRGDSHNAMWNHLHDISVALDPTDERRLMPPDLAPAVARLVRRWETARNLDPVLIDGIEAALAAKAEGSKP